MLILLFGLAVLAIVAAVNGAAALLWYWMYGGISPTGFTYPHGFFATNSLITVGLIGGGTLVELFNLREGGDAVASMAGGRQVSPSTHDLRERRLLNVVAEMAIASGIACPKVYVMDREDSINAFAAGYNPDQAVVAVTRGVLNRLTRDELQGVVAHEFSHILNGDMRLNVRLIGVLFGIQMVAGFGQQLIDAGTRFSGIRHRNDRGPSLHLILLALGIALYVIGYIGIVFGRLIKAAVSRQREYLADASAVQFTRNADGIGGALRKIGGLSRTITLGSRIDHPNAEHLSHLFLGAPMPRLTAGLFATHPPISERLRRIYGRSVDLLAAPEIAEQALPEVLPDIDYKPSGFSPAHISAAPSLEFGHKLVESVKALPELDIATHEPDSACALAYALLLARSPSQARQIILLESIAPPHQTRQAIYLSRLIFRLPVNARLPLLDLAMPALLQLPADQRERLLHTMGKLIAADQKVSLPEFVLQTILSRRLYAHAGRAILSRYSSLQPLATEIALLLSLVAHLAAANSLDRTAPQAFMRGAQCCPELDFSAEDMLAANSIRFKEVEAALDRAHQLMPLAKPALIKALLACAMPTDHLPMSMADLLRALCAALEAPMPPAVEAAYTASYSPARGESILN